MLLTFPWVGPGGGPGQLVHGAHLTGHLAPAAPPGPPRPACARPAATLDLHSVKSSLFCGCWKSVTEWPTTIKLLLVEQDIAVLASGFRAFIYKIIALKLVLICVMICMCGSLAPCSDSRFSRPVLHSQHCVEFRIKLMCGGEFP